MNTWFEGSGRLSFPLITVIVLVSPANGQTPTAIETIKSVSPSVSFKPVVLPVAVSIDAGGNIKYEVTRTVVTPVGEITFSASPPSAKVGGDTGFSAFENFRKAQMAERQRRFENDMAELSRARTEALNSLRNPQPNREQELSRKVAAFEEENRQLRAKLLTYEPAGQQASGPPPQSDWREFEKKMGMLSATANDAAHPQLQGIKPFDPWRPPTVNYVTPSQPSAEALYRESMKKSGEVKKPWEAGYTPR